MTNVALRHGPIKYVSCAWIVRKLCVEPALVKPRKPPPSDSTMYKVLLRTGISGRHVLFSWYDRYYFYFSTCMSGCLNHRNIGNRTIYYFQFESDSYFVGDHIPQLFPGNSSQIPKNHLHLSWKVIFLKMIRRARKWTSWLLRHKSFVRPDLVVFS